MNTIIYYFSGTGNSLKVAKDLSEHLGNVELVQIRQENMTPQPSADGDVIGFVLPTIFKGMPPLAVQFIRQLKIVKQSPYIFAVATHGDRNGMGIVFEQIEKLLEAKEHSLTACFAVQMPHNAPEKDHVTTIQEQERLLKEETVQIPLISESIRKQESVPHKNHKLKSLMEGLVYSSVYKSAKKNPFDKGFCVDERCNGCTSCSKVCPAANIEMSDGKPQWKQQNCQVCFACVQWCPKTAIQYKKRTIGVPRYHHPEIKASELYYRK